jgi:hypothetical protein
MTLMFFVVFEGHTNLQLRGGSGAWEGSVEFLLDNTNTWTSVCDSDFGESEAKAVCKMLGYIGRCVIWAVQIYFLKMMC